MAISSRTPEGEPAECPVCRHLVKIEPSVFYTDAPCPSCGVLLWFLRFGALNILVRPSDEARLKGLTSAMADIAGVEESSLRNNEDLREQLELDSMDLAEFLMNFEDKSSD